MLSPITGKEMELRIYERTINIRKEPFVVMYHVWHCTDSGEEFEDETMVDANIRQAADQYRSKYNLPFPEEIREVRELYDVSASKMSEVLRFGINQYKQYENGELPSESNASLIFLSRNPQDFIQLVSLSALDQPEKDVLINKAKKLLEKRILWQEKEWTMQLLMGEPKPDMYRGFRRPDLFKFAEMVNFFAHRSSPYKTQLNKLLFYSDFLHFRRHGRSISGAKYRAIEIGPVPNNFDSIYQFVENEGYVKMVHQEYPNGSIGTKFIPTDLKNKILLSVSEFETLEIIFQKFYKVKSQGIIQMSHEEVAWTKNIATHAVISYLDSYLLKAVE